jgi:hypothetical protein
MAIWAREICCRDSGRVRLTANPNSAPHGKIARLNKGEILYASGYTRSQGMNYS